MVLRGFTFRQHPSENGRHETYAERTVNALSKNANLAACCHEWINEVNGYTRNEPLSCEKLHFYNPQSQQTE